jgi:hypothetical protein
MMVNWAVEILRLRLSLAPVKAFYIYSPDQPDDDSLRAEWSEY